MLCIAISQAKSSLEVPVTISRSIWQGSVSTLSLIPSSRPCKIISWLEHLFLGSQLDLLITFQLNDPLYKCLRCGAVHAASSSKQSIEEYLWKACVAFFSDGQLGAFHGLLNSLSSRSIIEGCLLPVLLYGVESWILNSLLTKPVNMSSESALIHLSHCDI